MKLNSPNLPPRTRATRMSCLILLLSLSTWRPAAVAQTPDANVASPPPATNTQEEAVKMNPFEVQADSDNSYGALNSNSVTRFSAELDKLPVSADIMNERLMNDVMATSVEGMIAAYSAGSGYGGTASSSNAAFNQPGEINSPAYAQLRGLTASTTYRDGIMPMTTFNGTSGTGSNYTSTFDLDRIEIINGPQSLLYGQGGAGGVINMVTKQARLDQPAFGSVQYWVDQYGSKEAKLDYGMGNDLVAVRVAMIDGYEGTRRVNIGGALSGQYVQIAVKLPHESVLRVSGMESLFTRVYPVNATLTAASTANDARNGQYLRYLLASGQMNSAAGGAPSGAGVIDNGLLNWNNVDSLFGWWKGEQTVAKQFEATLDTKWTNWLTTQAGAGYFSYNNLYTVPGETFYAPNNTSNPQPGNWTVATTAGSPYTFADHPSHTKAARFSALATNDLFGGRAHSQTVVGADYSRYDFNYLTENYYQADSNWNALANSSSVANFGRTIIPLQSFTVNNGLVKYPAWTPGPERITVNGQNYVLQSSNPFNQFPVTPNDPLGVSLGGGSMQKIMNFSRGEYLANNTQWFDGKLDTLLGARFTDASGLEETQGSVPTVLAPNAGTTHEITAKTFSYNVGADYAVLPWLRPYFSVSDSYDAPLNDQNDPDGKAPKISHGVGEEVGLKLTNDSKTLSGSLAFYHVSSENEQYNITITLVNDINPSGLNGHYGASPTIYINVNRESEGVQMALTSEPTTNWRIRLSAALVSGTIENSTSYAQLYNDQFNENSAGQVTYADGTVVYVPATFNSKQLTVPSTTAGAMPLTVALMSSPTSTYYANPVAVTGQISGSANVAQVLTSVDPVHGAILTGATGLPITAIQINPGFTPPGTIPTSRAGDKTTGYPGISTNLTSLYTLSTGWAKGFRFGGSLQLGWKDNSYYYYPNGITPGAVAALLKFPTQFAVNPIFGYSRRFKRITWDSQLNISNVFNAYHVIILPNFVTGWAGPLNATFDQQPRSYQWTNRLSF